MNLKDAGIYDLTNIFKGKATDLHNQSQGEIINNKPRLINIPAYQRPYRWTKDNIEKLFQDYDDNKNEYFIGSAVAVEKTKNDNTLEFDIVDGQQRITTLYLLNYLCFMLMKEFCLEESKKGYQPKATEYCKTLKNMYCDLVGRNTAPFDHILATIDELQNEPVEEERVKKTIECYKNELCVPDERSTEEETLKEKADKAKLFFENEQLCLKYSRDRYNKTLKKALEGVYLYNVSNTNNFELRVNDQIINNNDQFISNYVVALKELFVNIWDRAQHLAGANTDKWVITKKAIDFAQGMIDNLSICVVITENEDDANKLFEVLNDRSLEVEDLELIKNHFYKEYCTKSNDDENTKDQTITELDELWTDSIFNPNENNAVNKNRLISYFAAVFFTMDKELGYKDDAKFKDSLNKKYSLVNYNNREYTKDDIKHDFNVYYAIKIILDKYGFKPQNQKQVSLDAEQGSSSISYKTFHILLAQKMHAVLPALINVIIANYEHLGNSLIVDDFGTKFSEYMDNIIADNKHTNTNYSKIHKCAYMLWVASMKAKNYVLPREIAKRIISKYGWNSFDNGNMDFENDEVRALDSELVEWLDGWNYSNESSVFKAKVLLLNLFLCSRDPIENGYKKANVTIHINDLNYRLNAGKLQLDHLEANKINETAAEKYYKYDNREDRQKEVNGYIGNFMILDENDNNEKNNVPLCDALTYYQTINFSWLVKDIEKMIKDPSYFDVENKIPKQEFFATRSKQLKSYFKCYLGKNLNQEDIDVPLR